MTKIKDGHYCPDWDFMYIRPGDVEWNCCICQECECDECKKQVYEGVTPKGFFGMEASLDQDGYYSLRDGTVIDTKQPIEDE
jgi:hypothetical protein